MMRYLFTAITIICLSIGALAQEWQYASPNYTFIEKEIKNESSQFYYPKLMKRYVDMDTTLTQEEFRCLYYGYTFQEQYEPYWNSPYEAELLKYYQSSKIRKKDYEKIINLANKSISEFPFDLRQMNFLGYVYHLKGDEEMALKVSSRFNGVMDAILSTGNGQVCETGYHVISVGHEYVILNMFQFQVTSQSLINNCDYMELGKDDRNVDGIYFNIERIMGRINDKLNHKK